MKRSGKLFVISGPSGAGKTTVVHGVLERLVRKRTQGSLEGCDVDRLVTYTSKMARMGEVNGVDYHFISADEFQKKIEEGFFLEWSNGLGHYYGTPRSVVDDLSRGKSYCLIIDREGAKQISSRVSDAVLVWLGVDHDVLKERLIKRGTDTPDQIQRRLERARRELQAEKTERLYSYHITNQIYGESVEQMLAIFVSELS